MIFKAFAFIFLMGGSDTHAAVLPDGPDVPVEHARRDKSAEEKEEERSAAEEEEERKRKEEDARKIEEAKKTIHESGKALGRNTTSAMQSSGQNSYTGTSEYTEDVSGEEEKK